MQRHETSFTELGAANRQHPRLQIDILKFEVACFAQAKAGDAQQAEQTIFATEGIRMPRGPVPRWSKTSGRMKARYTVSTPL